MWFFIISRSSIHEKPTVVPGSTYPRPHFSFSRPQTSMIYLVYRGKTTTRRIYYSHLYAEPIGDPKIYKRLTFSLQTKSNTKKTPRQIQQNLTATIDTNITNHHQFQPITHHTKHGHKHDHITLSAELIGDHCLYYYIKPDIHSISDMTFPSPLTFSEKYSFESSSHNSTSSS